MAKVGASTSTAVSAQGSTLSIGETPTPIGNLISFSGMDGSSAEIDVTNLVSTSKEYRLGLRDNGSFSIELDRDLADAGQVALLAAQASSKATPFALALSDGNTATFTGFVKKFSMSGGVDQVIKGSCDIRISGDITWTKK